MKTRKERLKEALGDKYESRFDGESILDDIGEYTELGLLLESLGLSVDEIQTVDTGNE